MTTNAIVWHPYYITLPGNVPRCRYKHAVLNGVVFVLDEAGPLTVLQDAARVAREMHDFYAPEDLDKRPFILCRNDSTWSRLEHVGGTFFLSYTLNINEGIAAALGEIQIYLPP